MKKVLLSLVLLVPALANADGWCEGPVVRVMADNSNCADANGKLQLAYVLNNISNKWLCARSDVGSSMVLAAKMAGKNVKAWVSVGSDCSQYNDYDAASFIWIDENQ